MCDSWRAEADTGGIWRGGAAGLGCGVAGLLGGLEGRGEGCLSGEGVTGFFDSKGEADVGAELAAGREGGSNAGADAGGVAFPRRRAGLT